MTGGRQGIGRGIVDRFIAEGARVYTCGRGQRPEDLPDEVLWSTTNVADTAAVRALVTDAMNTLGGLDILVNNAGVQIEKTVIDTTDDDWQLLMGVNVTGVFLLCRECIPKMSAGASIINIGSISASVSDPGMAVYNASKSFVQGLTRSIAVDHGPAIRCNAIAPGWVMTDMADAAFAVADDPQMAAADALVRHPVGRFGSPADIASMALWLASEESAYASGQVFTVDGGMTAASPLNPALF